MKINKLLLIFLVTIVPVFSSGVPDDVINLSKEVLTEEKSFFISPSFEKLKEQYGFKKETKVSDLVVGTPVKYFRLNSERISKDSSLNLEQYSYNWLCPVIEDNEIKMFVLIRKKNNEWKIANRGGFTLVAKEWNLVLDSWPYSEGYNPVIIDIGFNTYFHVPEVDSKNITKVETVRSQANALGKKAKIYKKLNYEKANVY